MNFLNNATDKQKFVLWTAFFYVVILGLVIYCLVTDFSNVQEFIYSEF